MGFPKAVTSALAASPDTQHHDELLAAAPAVVTSTGGAPPVTRTAFMPNLREQIFKEGKEWDAAVSRGKSCWRAACGLLGPVRGCWDPARR